MAVSFGLGNSLCPFLPTGFNRRRSTALQAGGDGEPVAGLFKGSSPFWHWTSVPHVTCSGLGSDDDGDLATLPSQTQTEDGIRKELVALQEDKHNYETTAKESLRRVLQEKIEVVRKLSEVEVRRRAPRELTFVSCATGLSRSAGDPGGPISAESQYAYFTVLVFSCTQISRIRRSRPH